MERTKDQFYEKTYVVGSEDPYNMALEFINFMTNFGEVSVTRNVLSTTGAHIKADVHFYLERKFDRYSKLFFLFKIYVDINTKTMEINALGLNQTQIPVGGHVGSVFQEWYMKHIQPEIGKKSSAIIDEITKNIEKYVSEQREA